MVSAWIMLISCGVSFSDTPKDAVRKALPLESVCRAMTRESESDILHRYRWLIAELLTIHDEK
jgi:hypothetical protein